jgi:hypothetical protein
MLIWGGASPSSYLNTGGALGSALSYYVKN